MNDLPARPQLGSPGQYARRYALLGVLFGLAFPVLGLALALYLEGETWNLAAMVTAHARQPLLWIIDTAPFFLGVFAALAGMRQDSLETANALLSQRAAELAAAQRSLEQRVDQRTQELEEHNLQLRQTVQIARQLSRLRDPSDLADAAVRAISQRLGDLIVDLYLIDDRHAEAILRASSAVESGPPTDVPPSVKVGDSSLVGQVAVSGDIGRSLTGPHGPELALPLLARGLPIGVVHLRPAYTGATLPGDTDLLTLITDQLAAAIETSRSFADANAAIEQLRAVTGESVQSAWKAGLLEGNSAYEYTPAGMRARPLLDPDDDPGALRVPLELRGQRIGAITLKRKLGTPWSPADRDLAEKTASQVALALENVRLLDDTRERARREQLLSEFSARLNQSVNLDTLLQTAVRELAALPDVAGASVYLNPETATADLRGAEPERGGH